jgi:hypothetical protein
MSANWSGAELVLKRCSCELNAELTPGLIHEVNNILTGIYFNLEACREVFDAEHPVAEGLTEINQGVERIKEILGRSTQIHLNTSERETTYHDLGALVGRQMDLLRIVFPKTVRITLEVPDEPLHVHVSEYAFRTALLTLAARLRRLLDSPKAEVPVVVQGAEVTAAVVARCGVEARPGEVSVAIGIPAKAASAGGIDGLAPGGDESDLAVGAAELLIGAQGGRLLICEGNDDGMAGVLLTLPSIDLNG